MESYKAIILTFSLRMNFLRVADIEHIKSHKGEILLWINRFKGPVSAHRRSAAGNRGACKRVQGRQSMPDFTGGYGFWKDVYDGQRDRAVAETDTGYRP